MHSIEKLRGLGLVRRSDELVLHGIGYDITIRRDGRAQGHDPAMSGDQRVEGRVEMHATDLFTLMDSETPLSLVLEDGRTLNFFVTNSKGRIIRADGGTL
jgi:hypothetical protein